MNDDPSRWTRREVTAGALLLAGATAAASRAEAPASIPLPPPEREAGPALAATLARRRSVRAWSGAALALAEVGQLLWAAQGVTASRGRRTAPSAGALYPLELDLVAWRVDGLAPALYRYVPPGHALERRAAAVPARELARAAHDQEWLAGAAAVIAVSGVTRRTAARYGSRAERYVAIEVGHVAQNVYLQAVGLGLGTVIVGAFDDLRVADLVGLAAGEHPLALLPVGHS